MTKKYNEMNEAFNRVDKENRKNKMGKDEVEKELQAAKTEGKEKPKTPLNAVAE